MFSLVVPAYNEGLKIYDNLMTIVKTLDSFGDVVEDGFEIIPVNDGSRDNTGDELFRAGKDDERIHPVSYEINKGKGGAVREGVCACKGDLIGFLDADLDLSPEHFRSFLKKQKESGCDIVIGSKMHQESKLEYPPARKLFSFGYYCLMKVLFGMKVKDTQTGVKLFKADIIKEVVALQRVKGYAFDVEQLALAFRMGATIVEMPITLEYQREESFGRIRFKDIWKMFTDTIGIWWNVRVHKTYNIKILR